ncbi:type II secretion system GspH family protein [bacterium]|nr:type II secretion system GspH family protein [bacterium]
MAIFINRKGFTSHTSAGLQKGVGFTLIELLVVVAIIGILSTTTVVNLNVAKAKARDARRLSDMKRILLALQIYYETNDNQYPPNPTIPTAYCGNMDGGYIGVGENFIAALTAENIMTKVPVDPLPNDPINYCYGYFLYQAGLNGCDSSRGKYFVLTIRNLETLADGIVHPSSPGWQCGVANWETAYDWVVGGYEN